MDYELLSPWAQMHMYNFLVDWAPGGPKQPFSSLMPQVGPVLVNLVKTFHLSSKNLLHF